jgi:hypothetical protein
MKSMMTSAVPPAFQMMKVPLVAGLSPEENKQSSRQMRTFDGGSEICGCPSVEGFDSLP